MKSVLVKGDSYCKGCAHVGNGAACLAESLPCWATREVATSRGKYLIIKIIEDKPGAKFTSREHCEQILKEMQ